MSKSTVLHFRLELYKYDCTLHVKQAVGIIP